MKCPFCAEEIQHEAIKCRFCGEFLEKSIKKPIKSPIVAAILNLFFWGAGYIYCGRAWGAAILIPFIFLLMFAAESGVFAVESGVESTSDFTTIIIANLPGIAMAYHAYKMAENDNRSRAISR